MRRLSSAQRFVLKEMTKPGAVTHLQRRYDRSLHALQARGLIRFHDQRGRYEVTAAGEKELGPKEWAVDVFEMRDGWTRHQHVATQLFYSELEARSYARANACEIGSVKNWAEVRRAEVGEKEFA